MCKLVPVKAGNGNPYLLPLQVDPMQMRPILLFYILAKSRFFGYNIWTAIEKKPKRGEPVLSENVIMTIIFAWKHM